jgi:hypothetical protein
MDLPSVIVRVGHSICTEKYILGDGKIFSQTESRIVSHPVITDGPLGGWRWYFHPGRGGTPTRAGVLVTSGRRGSIFISPPAPTHGATRSKKGLTMVFPMAKPQRNNNQTACGLLCTTPQLDEVAKGDCPGYLRHTSGEVNCSWLGSPALLTRESTIKLLQTALHFYISKRLRQT